MKPRWTIIAVALLLATFFCPGVARSAAPPTADRLLLLIPDDMTVPDSRVGLWLDAASEEGLHIVPIHDSEFIPPSFEEPACAGIILPDSIHRQASDAFLAGIRRFVSAGGKLMLVYDAGVLSPEGKYAPGRSRLSGLAGVDYALYDSLKEKTIAWGNVAGDSAIFRQLLIPPGKYYPFETESGALTSSLPLGNTFEAQLRRYKYGDVQYPSFVTEGNYAGQMLLHSASTIVAGEHKYEQGSVLFVNLPLGYLKANTDGLLLHAFLKFFAEHTLALPYLMSVPDGVGGLVLNWHIDSNAAIRPMQELASWTLLQQQGPYSIHVTAGPDAKTYADHLGFDVEHNPLSSALILQYSHAGHEIGSHGGWIHDYFAAHVETGEPAEVDPLLALNKMALEHVTGKPVVEYSAPSGNQPSWVTQWLDAHGFVAYYFTGNTGMGPTQGYRDGARESQTMWEFPILHLDRAAAFEEMGPQGYSDEEVEHWLKAVTQFAANNHSVRLVYFHPPGILPYKQAVMNWLEVTANLRADKRFRWYTMTQLANFFSSRKQVDWQVSRDGRLIYLDATHPQSLEHFTWLFPSSSFAKPKVVHGAASVKNQGDAWMVVAGKVTHIQIKAEVQAK